MNQAELIAAVATSADVSKTQAEVVIKAVGEVVAAELSKGGDATLPGIGKLSITQRAAREGRNPATGEAIKIAAKKAVKFGASKPLKDALNTPAKKDKK